MNSRIKSQRFNYGAGALAVFAVSLGVAAILYGGGFLVFEPLSLFAWALGPLGIYTVIYAFRVRGDCLYYLTWGLIMLVFGLSSALYKVVNVIILFGLLLVFLAVVGSILYWRRRM